MKEKTGPDEGSLDHEVERIAELHADLCKMLSNATRLMILEQLKEGEKSVGELVDTLGYRQSNISQHLSKMKKKDLVRGRREGSNIYYSLSYPKITEACDIIREVLFEQLEKDKELVERGDRYGQQNR